MSGKHRRTSQAVRTDAGTRRRDPVPDGIRVGARYTGGLLVIGAGIAVVGVLVVLLSEIVIPFLVGLILSALMVPFSSFLHRHRWPRWLAILVAWVTVFALLAALTLLVIQQVRTQLPRLEDKVGDIIQSAQAFLDTQPFGITEQDLAGSLDAIVEWVKAHASGIGSGALAAGSAVVHALEGVFIVLFVTLFAMIDGAGIWAWFVRIFPRRAQPRIGAAGAAGWHTLSAFIRVQLAVAAVDAVGIGIGAFILGVPLAVPIAVIVFFGSFVPIVGAIVTGAIAVALALMFNGWVHALIMLGIVLLVQQVESHVLHPLLTGSAVKVHPLGVVLGVTTGTAIAGIAGAFFAVPAIATANSMIAAARHHGEEDTTALEPEPTVGSEDGRRRRRCRH